MFEGNSPRDDRVEDPGLEYGGGSGAEEVCVDNGQIRLHAGFENPQAIFGEGRVGRARGETAECVFRCEMR